ncbi:MAG: hypothetical protein J6E41_02635 [Lachnospiraceae bacterium]|nr:hypothetical protein [Lachnospiraceae bacterium]
MNDFSLSQQQIENAAGAGCFICTSLTAHMYTVFESDCTDKFLSRKKPVSALTRFNERRKATENTLMRCFLLPADGRSHLP